MMAAEAPQGVQDRITQALSRIARSREEDGHVLIDLPLMYPSGAMVVVEVERNRDRYWVSDMGYGLVEAEFMAAQDYYGSAAKRAADEFSVGFDGNAIFALWVPEARLESAIVCVANASSKASSEAVLRAAEAQGRRQNEQIFDRIKKVFGQKSVAKEAEIGGRHATWGVHNVVALPKGQKAVFEFMSNHANSVSSKFLMFSDIRAAEPKYSLNAVVRKVDQLDEKAQMIGDVANIVGIDAPDEEFQRFARAA